MKNIITRTRMLSAFAGLFTIFLLFSCQKAANTETAPLELDEVPDYDNMIYESIEYTSASAELSRAREKMTVTSVGDSAFFIGGSSIDGSYVKFDDVDIYNGKTFKWSVSRARTNEFVNETTIGKWVFSPGPVPYVTITDLQTASQQSLTLSSRRSSPVVAKSGNLVVFGGGLSFETPVSDSNRVVDIYDLNLKKIIKTTKVPDVVKLKSGVGVNGKIYFQCNVQKFDGAKFIEVYDLKTDTWEQIPAPDFLGKIYYSLGRLIFQPVNDGTKILIYDISKKTWESAEIPAPRPGYGFVITGNLIFLPGGGVSQMSAQNRLDVYDMLTGKWTVKQLSSNKYGVVGARAGNLMLFADGSSKRVDFFKLIPKK
ncbi:MAG: hypothetical protein INR69_15100 [Mucilaginibacter polytrichastri]|nr:hypothetical protein [Mucilaginibacter polytrichastri]